MKEGLRATKCLLCAVCLYVWSPDRCVLFVCLAGSNYMNKKVWCHQHTRLYEQEHYRNSFGVDNRAKEASVSLWCLSVCLFGPTEDDNTAKQENNNYKEKRDER